MTRSMYVYWPVLLMVGTVVLACLYDPADTEAALALAYDGPRALAMLTSPYLWVCVVAAAFGLRKARRTWVADGQFTDTEKMVTVWFLINACWYHTGCDVMSGLFQVMPNLRDCYAASNGAHHFPMHHPERAYLDAVYWFELFVQFPLCVYTFFLYLHRSPIRPAVEAFLCGLHLTGTVAYYLPNLLMGETTHPIMSNLDRAIASLWIIVPALLTVRAARELLARYPVQAPHTRAQGAASIGDPASVL